MSRYEARYALSDTEYEIEDYDTFDKAREAAVKRTGSGSMRPDSIPRRAIRADVLCMDGGYGAGTVVFSAYGSGRGKTGVILS